ncbi:holo-ACP synthase [Alkalihalobacillus sp. MEB130]|uniref:holo-ACP synthase n=1 Tax=Alkalihalobacillus sp. MEB130 TaxID=2976704 RepID=UPI0028DDFB7C|nr:holo-ACP synthase [Alkalihalobacillus sp. MEB130]MDT8862706.1 holo-ACP synthase [Alkalihalobacillus sp. MEB130]
MIVGIGVDLIELERIAEVVKRQPRFIDRVFTHYEKNMLTTYTGVRKMEFLAGRFAAKEAFVKAAGTGISKKYSWLDIEVRKEASGKPTLVVAGLQGTAHLSISHSENYAIAQVIIEN